MRGFKFIFLMMTYLSLHVSCLERINFELETGLSDSLAIHARLIIPEEVNEKPQFTLRISNVFDFDSQARREVRVKLVKLFDTNGNEMEAIQKTIGTYQIEFDDNSIIQPTIGNSYFAEIETLEGRLYRSELEVLLGVQNPDNLDFEIVRKESLDKSGEPFVDSTISFIVDVNFDPNEERIGVMWESVRVWKMTDCNRNICYITEFPGLGRTQYLFDPVGLSEITSLRPEILSISLDPRFTEGSLVTISQYALSPGALTYYRNINTLLEKNGNMFDVPASRIGTNWKNIEDSNDQVFGYFFASQSRVRQIQFKERTFDWLTTYCPFRLPAPGCDICCDCRTVNLSNTQPPDAWVD